MDWCSSNQGQCIMSAISAMASFFVAVLALFLSQNMARKQYNQSLYDKRQDASKHIDCLLGLIGILELYQKRLLEQPLKSKKKAISIIEPYEIKIDWVYDFKKVKYIANKSNRKEIEDISIKVEKLIRNYMILKENIRRDDFNVEDAEEVYKDIKIIKEKCKKLNDYLEEKLQLV